MKLKKRSLLGSVSRTALGVFLGFGAQAYTVLDFENQTTNVDIAPPFGDNASTSSDGVTVNGFGTPNIGLTWGTDAGGDGIWQYYNDSVWTAAQLDNSAVGVTHAINFVPNSAAASVVLQSFNFHPYYESMERFTYRLSVLAGTNVLSGPTNISFLSDATKQHPVNINYTGAPGQTLSLRLERLASTLGAGEAEGDPYDIAIDDITFAQVPEQVLPVGPQVGSVRPSPGQTGLPAIYYSYEAGITNRDTTVVTNSIRLALDGALVSPPVSISSADDVTYVLQQGTNLLASGSVHLYSLTFEDSAGAKYTNEVQFTVANYATLPLAFAHPPGSGTTRGFTYRTVAAPEDTTGMDNTVARAKAQLNGTLIDTNTGLPFVNIATPGTNADGSFSIDSVLNFADNDTEAGNFPNDQQFPGLEAGPYNWFSTEALLYLDLSAGYHRLGVNSDDGFEFNAMPPLSGTGTPIQLGVFDDARAEGNTFFDFITPTNGLYRFQLIYFEGTGSASCELFSVQLAEGTSVLINDPVDPNAVKSYSSVVSAPVNLQITRITQSGTTVILEWANGTAPFQVQFTPSLSPTNWTNVGSTTSNRTATVPITGNAGFIRVFGQ